MAYPARSQALLGGLHHHLITHDGRIDFTGIHLVIRAHPSIIGNAANKENKRSPKDRPITSKPRLTSSSLLQKLRRIQHHHTGWMIITSRRSNPPSLNNGIHHSLLHRTILKLATRIPRPSQIQITHNQALQQLKIKQTQSNPNSTQSSNQPNAHQGPKCPNGYQRSLQPNPHCAKPISQSSQWWCIRERARPLITF